MRKPRIQWRHVAPIALSIVAVAVSAVGLYIQSIYGTANLSMQLTGFSIQPHGNGLACTVDVALFNSGNRDTALLRVGLRQGRTVTVRSGTQTTINSDYAEYFADTNPPGYVDTVVKGGDIKLLAFEFPGCTPSAIEARLKSGNLNMFSLETDAVNYAGKRSHVSTSFATGSIPASGNLALTINLAGQFNLLKDGASYHGESKGNTASISVAKNGTVQFQTHTVTISSSK